MAESKISVAQDEFSCSVCLETLKDPAAIPCGHSFCMVCINNCWDQEDDKGAYSCPQCRQTFTPRPVVRRNTILAGVVEKLKKTEPQAPHPGHCSPGPEDVDCDFCTEKKCKAVKSCLVCLVSFCETHLQPHYQIPAYKNHKLVKASRRLQDQICSQHNKLLEVYCRTDQQCICLMCTMDDHKGHDTISAAAERTEKQKQLLKIQRKFQKKIQNREKELCELINAVESHKTAEVSQAEKLLKQVEQQIVELKRKDAELEQLSHTEDPVHFLQNFQSLSAPAGSAESAAITISPFLSFNDVTKSEIREDFLQYVCRFTLDPNTVNKNLRLSEENKVVTCSETSQSYPDHPDRFDVRYQVVCRESVSGRCYWEVEWSGNDGVFIAVSYKSISRKGRGGECVFGRNDQSWSLLCSPSKFSFWHNNIETKIPIMPSSSRIGVYVDYEAGTLSFYSVSDTMKLLHRVQTTFTQLLYPGFYLDYGSEVKLSD
ncbi:E3 ubiquitin/ISG15 ligase TRIM25-like [Trichomycterus rosablanca]|uniref:E3 ubiquitin/ISG15 ligase TRIM25-like n=1 Tax=Trichomycterus rosablanca TaxID=2290929 RepID=UPI002F35D2D7